MNEAQIERRWVTQRRGQVILYAKENVSDKTEILLIGGPCEVYEEYYVLAFKA
jgi:hypothetical protein